MYQLLPYMDSILKIERGEEAKLHGDMAEEGGDAKEGRNYGVE